MDSMSLLLCVCVCEWGWRVILIEHYILPSVFVFVFFWYHFVHVSQN